MAASDGNIGTLTIASYNLRGLNQGQHFLGELMKTHDIILIQEHWLSSDDSHKTFMFEFSIYVFCIIGNGS